MKPTNVNAAAQKAEQRVRIAVEQVKLAERKARAAKDKAWRTKLLFKLARRAFKKAKKAAKRARAKAVQAQIALRELTEQLAPAKRLTALNRTGALAPKLGASKQPYTAAAKRKRPVGAPRIRVRPPGVPTPHRPGETTPAAKPMQVETAARLAKKRSQALDVAECAGVESISARPGAMEASEEPTGLGDFGEGRIRPVQAPPEQESS